MRDTSEIDNQIKECTDKINNYYKIFHSTLESIDLPKEKKQMQKLYNNLSSKSDFSKYIKKTSTIFKKNSLEMYRNDKNNILSKLNEAQSELFNRVVDEVSRRDIKYSDVFQTLLINLRSAYHQKSLLENKKQAILNGKQEQFDEKSTTIDNRITTNSKTMPELTDEERRQERERVEKENISKNIKDSSEKIMKGPKSKGLSDIIYKTTPNTDAINELYSLSFDIIAIMNDTQYVQRHDKTMSEEDNVYNIDLYSKRYSGHVYDEMLKCYGVNSVDELLEVYGKLRDKFYNKAVKLKPEEFSKYKLSNIRTYSISANYLDSYHQLYEALCKQNIEFPPSRSEIISIINGRILTGKNYRLVQPKEEKERSVDPKDYQNELEVKKYYKNLTKNMSIEQITSLYNVVRIDMERNFRYSSITLEKQSNFYAIMQKLFCEIILEKQQRKFVDNKQKDAIIKEIAENILEEPLKFSIYGYNDISSEQKEQRKQTIYEEYLKYRNGKKKTECLPFGEYVKQAYPDLFNDFTNEEISKQEGKSK